ncbi:glycosyltransferase family 2 protein [Ectopseudomonas chengduensis]
MKTVVILLSTYNGSRFLRPQVESLYNQSHAAIKIFVRDDGSFDDTLDILESSGLNVLPENENLGAKKSFSALLNYAVLNCDADYFMFCDQDDVWFCDKVKVTLSQLQAMESIYGDIPLLVHTDLEVVDETLNVVSHSMWEYEYILPQKNKLSRLLVQNTVTGCTMMINRKLAEKCLFIPSEAIMHDWWIALAASYFGKIGYVKQSTIKYRQHARNTIGAKKFDVRHFLHFLILFKCLFFRDKSCLEHLEANLQQARAFLNYFEADLDSGTRKMLSEFACLRHKSFFQRRVTLLKYKLLRQGFIRNFSLLFRI